MSYPPPEPQPGQPQPGQQYPGYPPTGAPGYPPQPVQAATQYPGYGQQQMVPPGYPPPAPPYPGYPPQPYPGQPGYGPPQYLYGSPQYPQMQMMPVKEANPRATQAMIYSFVALALSILTFIGIFAFAGIISGAVACFYSIGALNAANRLPGKTGQGQAITGIILGSLAILIVIGALALRAAFGSG